RRAAGPAGPTPRGGVARRATCLLRATSVPTPTRTREGPRSGGLAPWRPPGPGQEPPLEHRHEAALADDQVIHHADPDQSRTVRELLGERDVEAARLRIAGGMVVREDHRAGPHA